MKLLKLRLQNFKGIASFDLETNGADTNIYGANASGKTTLQDAFQWLLFDKDSAGRKNFEIKTLDENGEPHHGLEHAVEGIFALGGRETALRKVFTEKWARKKGGAAKELTGHTVDYFIDGLPVKKGAYERRIAGIAGEEIFKLLTSPKYFNEQLHWQKRREILLSLCGEIDDREVMQSQAGLAGLPAVLQGRSPEEYRKICQARRAELLGELDRIPVRIDETLRGLPPGKEDEAEGAKLPAAIAARKKLIKSLQQEILRIENGGEAAEKMKALREVEAVLLAIQNECRQRNDARAAAKRAACREVEERIAALRHAVKCKERESAGNDLAARELPSRIEELRAEWHRVNAEEFVFARSSTCPACGQPLPAAQLQAAREKALACFNRGKAERLAEISAGGKAASQRLADLRQQNDALAAQIDDARQQADELRTQEKKLRAELAALERQGESIGGAGSSGDLGGIAGINSTGSISDLGGIAGIGNIGDLTGSDGNVSVGDLDGNGGICSNSKAGDPGKNDNIGGSGSSGDLGSIAGINSSGSIGDLTGSDGNVSVGDLDGSGGIGSNSKAGDPGKGYSIGVGDLGSIAGSGSIGDLGGINSLAAGKRYAAMLQARERLLTALASLEKGSRQETGALRQEIARLEQENHLAEKRLAAAEQYRRGQERIAELKARERELAAACEQLSAGLELAGQFIRTKVQLLEGRLNSRFRYARFKLFNVLLNGSVEECCETICRGVPYSALNNAARINAGLDIINTLAEHYGLAAPIWIDNREAVTELIPARAQIISLIVSAADKELRVETAGKKA